VYQFDQFTTSIEQDVVFLLAPQSPMIPVTGGVQPANQGQSGVAKS
jgi:hypothetical protein